MIVSGNRKPERANQQQLPRSRLQQIGAAHDLRDLHGSVVDDDRQLICGNIVAPPDHEVAEIFARNVSLRPDARSSNAIASPSGTRNRQFTPAGPSWRGLADPFAAAARIHRLIVAFVRRGRRSQVLARAGAGIDEPAVAQLAPGVEVESRRRLCS